MEKILYNYCTTSSRIQYSFFSTLKHAFSAIIPCFWLQLDVKLEPYAYDFIRMSVMTIPKIAFFVGIGLVVVGGVVPILLGLSLYYRHRK